MSSRPAVFITGASSGLGVAFARHYAAAGFRVGLVARRGALVETLAGELPEGGHLAYACDVADAEAMARAADDFMAVAGVPQVVLANAGVSAGTLTECVEDFAAFERVLRTNVLGMVATFQPFVMPMRNRGDGRLAGVASVAGIRGLPGAGAYSASKAAVIRYLESLRVELAGTGVRVVTLAPGYIRTPMTDVNDYRMPFLMPADIAVIRMAGAIARGVGRYTVPWQMGLVARVMGMLPIPVYDFLAARSGRKPRGLLENAAFSPKD